MHKRAKGKEGEDIAVEYLQNLNYQILDRNYQAGHAEIDIIAKDKDEIVFVEVKYRKSLEYGRPEDGISLRKRKLIRKAAEDYLFKKNIENISCRIDFIGILQFPGHKPEIVHYKDAM